MLTYLFISDVRYRHSSNTAECTFAVPVVCGTKQHIQQGLQAVAMDIA